MSDDRHSQHQEELYLIGARIDPDISDPQFFTLLISGGETDRPVVVENRLIAFTSLESSHLIELIPKLSLPSHLAHPDSIPREMEYLCDIAETLHLVENKDVDSNSTILDCLNYLLDCIRVLNVPAPEEYRKALEALADHLTFSRNISLCFTNSTLCRQNIIDGILWSIGAVAARLRFL